jgi:hypothetical protein
VFAVEDNAGNGAAKLVYRDDERVINYANEKKIYEKLSYMGTALIAHSSVGF